MADMVRNPVAFNAAVGTSEANSDPIQFQDNAGGYIHVPATEGSITLSYYVAVDEEDSTTWQIANDEDGVPLSVSVSGGQSYALKKDLFGALRFKLVASAISGGTSISYKFTTKS